MIDLRTARITFSSQSNTRIDHFITLCHSGRLFICHHEEDAFRKDPKLSDPFIIEQCCVYEPDDDVYDRCPAIGEYSNGKQILEGNEAAIFIAATALSKNFGVISNHRSEKFVTVYDLCLGYGVPVLSADDYFSLV